MASFERRGNGVRADVNINGVREKRTFPTKLEAQAWAAKREAELRDTAAIPKTHTVKDLFEAFIANRRKLGKMEEHKIRWEENRFNFYLKEFPELETMLLADMTPKVFADMRDKRLKVVTGGTVARDLNLMSAAFQLARKEWRWITESPLSTVARPDEGQPRSRRVEAEDIRRLLLALNYVPGEPVRTGSQRVALIFLLALETGMRSGEICQIKWEHVDFENKTVFLPQTKNDTARTVPLSEEAEGIITIMQGLRRDDDDRVFRMSIRQRDSLFRKARNKTGLEDIKFHDTRREGLTRLADVFQNPMDLAKISGHKNLQILLEHYYAPKAKELADKLRAAKRKQPAYS